MVSIASIVILIIVSAIPSEGQSFSNCGSGSDIIQLTNGEIQPFPILIPSVANFILEVDLKEDLANPIQAVFKLSKKFLLFWIDVPCENDIGSCTYLDWCVFCKACKCPFLAGRQTMVIPLNVTDVVPTGEYRVQIEFTSATSQYGCVYAEGIQIENLIF